MPDSSPSRSASQVAESVPMDHVGLAAAGPPAHAGSVRVQAHFPAVPHVAEADW